MRVVSSLVINLRYCIVYGDAATTKERLTLSLTYSILLRWLYTTPQTELLG